MTDLPARRRLVAASAYKDLFGDLRNRPEPEPKPTVMDGKTLAELLVKNFGKLDLNGDGVSLREIRRAETMPFNFSAEEQLMLKVLERYFETICNLVDDEPGPDTVISHMDVQVLAQFLEHSSLTIEQLQEWRRMAG
ncbi:MAG: hypothetical protein KGS72_13805 [Cyanobacteria bacterium REEB67]|nr:hypothetical protein [Cyanobacteria bacterium REEB67]